MDLPSFPFIPARLRSGKRKTTRLIVIHTAECKERGGAGRSVAAWFQNRAAKGSAHAVVDAEGITQTADWDDRVAGARGGDANATGLHIEHVGVAAQTAAEWDDEYSRAVLLRSAALVSALCSKYGVPPTKLTAAQVAAGASGFCGHADVTAAFAVRGGHTDPGPAFPWDRYLSMVRTSGWKAPDPSPPMAPPAAQLPEPVPSLVELRRSLDAAKKRVVRKGDSGPAVRWVQGLLSNAGLKTPVDGSFGQLTERNVIRFQKLHRLRADGVVGPKTWEALDK